jgi:phosphoribosylformylglycinamidine synthase
MKNDYQIGDTKISIPPTVLFSVIGKIADSRKAISMDVKQAGDLVYLLGETADELGGSEYYAKHDELGCHVPQVAAEQALLRYRTLNRAQEQQLVASCHDLSDGGLGVALAESAFAGGYGIQAELSFLDIVGNLRDDHLLFSETQSRLLVTVRESNKAVFEKLFVGQSCCCIGRVIEEPTLIINGLHGQTVIRVPLDNLKQAWQAPLKEM